MFDDVSRRGFLALMPAVAAVPAFASQSPAVTQAVPADAFPSQDPKVVREMVGASHGNVARVKELVALRPALARAAWDWGYGDWETALGAASHVGNVEIATILLASGAHPTIFSAAMLGELDVVKAFVAAVPGVQRTRGPHGITLLSHAKAGGAAEVVKYLESLGDADRRYENLPLTSADEAAVMGTYAFGGGATDRLIVAKNSRGDLTVKREGASERNLFHHGGRAFNPAGAEAVRLRFSGDATRATTLIVEDGDVTVTARRL
jgi:hypothetical protein